MKKDVIKGLRWHLKVWIAVALDLAKENEYLLRTLNYLRNNQTKKTK